jgi:hypothetical protein
MKLILFFIVLSVIPIINASQLGISPSNLYFNGTVGKENCDEIKITSDYVGNLIGELKWARFSSKEIKYYNLDGNYFQISEKYPEKIYFEGKDRKTFEICFNGKKQGNYSGLLIYKTEKSYAGIGIWVHLILNKESNINKKLILYSSPTTLLFLLLFLLILKRNNQLSEPFSE